MKRLVSLLLFAIPWLVSAQKYTLQDSLRGTLNPNRTWYNVLHYGISVTPNFSAHTIKGKVTMRFEVTGNNRYMQIDLQYPMVLDTVLFENKSLRLTRLGHSFLIEYPAILQIGSHQEIHMIFHGKPQEAKMPPWDGGWVWKEDPDGEPWVSVACQGLGASCWYPCKDHQSDKPDSGAIMAITVPQNLMGIGNGKLTETRTSGNESTYVWEVKSPINTYNLIPYIGQYVSFSDTITGEAGILNCQYWVLPHHKKKAHQQFQQVRQMLKAHEYWFGPYPFYEDGYKLVEAPYLGMEHQSNIAYGNKFSNGYLGTDLSGSGWGMKWDYIIVHESGHEWFGNSITSNDLADMWIHESFTDYSEILFTEYWYGKEAGLDYLVGLRKNIANDKPIIADYGVNKEGSTDMYYKGSQLIHIIRTEINNDTIFRQMLRDMQAAFRYKSVDSKTLEDWIINYTHLPLKTIFDQYLRTADIPFLALHYDNEKWECKWVKSVPDLWLPIRFANDEWVTPSDDWKPIPGTGNMEDPIKVDGRFYINTQVKSLKHK